LTNFRGLSSLVYGVSYLPDGNLSPKIDGQIMNPVTFWSHDLTYSGMQQGISDFYKVSQNRIAQQTVLKCKDYINALFFLTYEKIWKSPDKPVELHVQKYREIDQCFPVRGYSYFPLQPCAIYESDWVVRAENALKRRIQTDSSRKFQ
jgi:hypothetical protein